MIFARHRFIAASTLMAIAVSISVVGCSDSEGDSGGDTAEAVANAAAPKLNGLQGGSGNQGANEFGAPGDGGDDYGGEDYDQGNSGGGGGMAAAMGGGSAGHGGSGGMSSSGDNGHGGGGGMALSPSGGGGMSQGDSGGHGNSGAGGMMAAMGGNGGGSSYGSGEDYGEGEYDGGGMGMGIGMGMGAGSGGGRGMNAGGQGSSLPGNFSQWSDDDFVTAAKEKNSALVAAIQTKGQASVGDPAFADLMGRVLNESAGVPSGPPGGFGFGGFPGAGGSDAGSGKGMATPYQPATKVPPGGAFMFPGPKQRLRSNLDDGPRPVLATSHDDDTGLGLSSIEWMVAESLLGYTPQAAGATLGRAQGMQGASGGSGMTLQPPGLQGSGGQRGGPPSLQGSGGQRGGPPGGGGMGMGMGIGLGGSGGPPGRGRGNSGPGSPVTGNLAPEELVKAVVSGLVSSNTPQAWRMLDKIYNGDQPTPISPEDAQGFVLSGVLQAAEFDEAVVKTLLQSAFASAVASPRESQKTLEVLTAASGQTAEHYFKFGRTARPSLPAGGNGNRGMVGGGMGMGAGMGIGGPGSGAGPGAPGMGMGMGAGMGIGGPGRGSNSGMAGSGMAGPGSGAGPGAPGMGMGMGAGMGIGGPGRGSNSGMAGSGMAGPGSGAGPGAPGLGMGMGAGMGMGMGPGEGEGEGDYGDPGYGSGDYGGGPPGGNRPTPGVPSIRIAPAMFPILASVLWNESSAASLAAAITSAGDLQTAEPLMPLAVSIPNDSVRKAVFEILQTQYKSGAGGLISVGFFTSMLSDPGMLPVLKSLPRQRPPRQATGPNVGAPAQATPESSWTDGTKQAVLALRDRMRTAAGNPDLAYDGAMPVRLHRDAIPQRSIRFTTSTDDFKQMGTDAPSQTTYYYASCSIAPTRPRELDGILEHYEKRAKAFRRLNADQTMLWFDGMKTSADGSRVSLDVIIEQAGGRSRGGNNGGGDYGGGPPGAGGGGNGQYQIEVIIVETRDPKAATDDESDPSI